MGLSLDQGSQGVVQAAAGFKHFRGEQGFIKGHAKLIFDINVAFSRRKFPTPISDDTSEEHLRFVRAWKDAKLLEMSAIDQGDVTLAALAGQHSRQVWHRRILSRFPQHGI